MHRSWHLLPVLQQKIFLPTCLVVLSRQSDSLYPDLVNYPTFRLCCYRNDFTILKHSSIYILSIKQTLLYFTEFALQLFALLPFRSKFCCSYQQALPSAFPLNASYLVQLLQSNGFYFQIFKPYVQILIQKKVLILWLHGQDNLTNNPIKKAFNQQLNNLNGSVGI